MYVFIAREALGGGPNLVCTVLVLSIRAHLEAGRPLGSKLHLQLDNTTSENKNIAVIGLVALLVAWGVFREASIFFMPVGHTYNELDATFTPLIDMLMANAVPTISALLEIIQLALAAKRIRTVQNLSHLWDFSGYLKQYMHSAIGGFSVTQQSSGMHEFYFSRDADGDVRMKARQSSQACTWLPEGDGDLIFREIPDPASAPPLAAISSDVSWEKASVAVNVRRWLPFLGLTCDELNKAIAEWESVFDSMPVDGDVTRLREDELLQWVPLPAHVDVLDQHALRVMAGTCASGNRHSVSCRTLMHFSCVLSFADDVCGGDDQVENPPVNPITGLNRTSATVRAELRRYNDSIRESAAIKPLFLSDHIFFNVPGKGVQLGRIAHAPYGGALRESDTVDVTEYEHRPQAGVSGFFGTFLPLKNVNFNKETKGSLRFVRHRDVNRKNIVVFNVKMLGIGDTARVALSSLRELERAMPQIHTLPRQIPASHKRDVEHPQNRVQRLQIDSTAPVNQILPSAPLAKAGDRIEVYWTDDPVGWFPGVVTSNRKEDGVFVTRVRYITCAQFPRSHSAWHRLDPSSEDHVKWRFVREHN